MDTHGRILNGQQNQTIQQLQEINMRNSASIVAAFGLVALGYLIGSANLLAPKEFFTALGAKFAVRRTKPPARGNLGLPPLEHKKVISFSIL